MPSLRGGHVGRRGGRGGAGGRGAGAQTRAVASRPPDVSRDVWGDGDAVLDKTVSSLMAGLVIPEVVERDAGRLMDEEDMLWVQSILAPVGVDSGLGAKSHDYSDVWLEYVQAEVLSTVDEAAVQPMDLVAKAARDGVRERSYPVSPVAEPRTVHPSRAARPEVREQYLADESRRLSADFAQSDVAAEVAAMAAARWAPLEPEELRTVQAAATEAEAMDAAMDASEQARDDSWRRWHERAAQRQLDEAEQRDQQCERSTIPRSTEADVSCAAPSGMPCRSGVHARLGPLLAACVQLLAEEHPPVQWPSRLTGEWADRGVQRQRELQRERHEAWVVQQRTWQAAMRAAAMQQRQRGGDEAQRDQQCELPTSSSSTDADVSCAGLGGTQQQQQQQQSSRRRQRQRARRQHDPSQPSEPDRWAWIRDPACVLCRDDAVEQGVAWGLCEVCEVLIPPERLWRPEWLDARALIFEGVVDEEYELGSEVSGEEGEVTDRIADGYGAAAYGGDGWTDDDDDDEYQARVYAVGREGRDC